MLGIIISIITTAVTFIIIIIFVLFVLLKLRESYWLVYNGLFLQYTLDVSISHRQFIKRFEKK